jgi:hypothetical protein
MTNEERRLLFPSEVANMLTRMKVDREPVYKMLGKKGRTLTTWFGSPMHIDGEC